MGFVYYSLSLLDFVLDYTIMLEDFRKGIFLITIYSCKLHLRSTCIILHHYPAIVIDF